jgi:DNA invertase Pin-like site-specific DNA recombinase
MLFFISLVHPEAGFHQPYSVSPEARRIGPMGRLFITIISSIAELERSLILDRINAGMACQARRFVPHPLLLRRLNLIGLG